MTLKEPNGMVTRGERITLTDDFRDGFVQSLSVTARDDTRIAAERAVRRDGNVTEFQNGRFTPCKRKAICRRSGVSARHGSSMISCGNDYLSGCAVRNFGVRSSGAVIPARRSIREAAVGFPCAILPDVRRSRLRRRGPLLLRAGAQLRLHVSPDDNRHEGCAVAGRTGSPPLVRQRHRHLQTVKVAAIDQDYTDLPGTAAESERFDGWRGCSIETKASSHPLSSLVEFRLGCDLESDDYFRRFYKLDNPADRPHQSGLSDPAYSERNYFGAHLYHFGGLRIDDTPTTEGRVHPIIDYNYVFADPLLGGELTFNANALSFSRGIFIRRLVRRSGSEPGRRRRQLAPPVHRLAGPDLYAVRQPARRYLRAQ